MKRTQRGFSLFELMISLAIGVILLLALASVYVTSSKTNRIREANEQLDETARQVFDRLEYDLNLAGYVDIFDSAAGGGVYASALADFNNQVVQNMYARIVDDPAVMPMSPMQRVFGQNVRGFVGSNNSMTITYQIAPKNVGGLATLPAANNNADSGWGLDCLAQQTGNPDTSLMTNTYVYDAASQTLRCNRQPFMGNNANNDTAIAEMTFRYLATVANNNRAVGLPSADVYTSQAGLYTVASLTANEVENGRVADPTTGTAAISANLLGWNNVTAVEICMIVAGAPLNGQLAELSTVQPQVPTCVKDNSNTSGFADNINRANNDNRLYRRYVKVLSIPNALYYTN